MPKVFIDPSDVCGTRVVIREDAHHLTHVLRSRVGDKVRVCDTKCDYECEIVTLGETVEAKIIAQRPVNEMPIEITLFQGLPKQDKLEWIIEKGVEVGISVFVPVKMQYAIAKVEDKKAGQKNERWNAISRSAAAQSGREKIPTVRPAMDFGEMLRSFSDYDLVLVCYENEHSVSLKQALSDVSPRKIAVIIGPEGGISPSEIAACEQAGARSVTLGPRILRTETAGLVAAADLCYALEME